MGNILSLFTYLLTYYFRFRSGTRVPVVLPNGYPGNKLPGYGSPNYEPRKTAELPTFFQRLMPNLRHFTAKWLRKMPKYSSSRIVHF